MFLIDWKFGQPIQQRRFNHSTYYAAGRSRPAYPSTNISNVARGIIHLLIVPMVPVTAIELSRSRWSFHGRVTKLELGN